MLAISTGMLMTATILAFVVGILLIGGGIAYLILQNRKERKAAARNARRQEMQARQSNFAPLPGTPVNPPAAQPPKTSE